MPTRLEKYQALPEVVRLYLFDQQKESKVLEVLKKDGLNEAVAFSLLLVAEDVVLKDVKMSDFAGKVRDVGKLSDDQAGKIVKDLIGWRLLPLREYLDSSFGEEMKRLGINLSDYSGEVLEKHKTTPEAFVKELLVGEGLKLSSEELQHRLEFLLVAYLRGVRTKEQTVMTMGRAIKVGGLELLPEQAGLLIDKLEERKATVEVEIISGPVPEKSIERSSVSLPPKPVATDVSKQIAPAPAPIPTPTPAPAPISLAARDAEDLAKRYTVLTGKAPTEAVAPLMTARVTAAVSKSDELTRSAEQLDSKTKVILRQTAPRPTPVIPTLSDVSLPPTSAGSKIPMHDVKYVHRLTGPLEELQMMGLVDFHRLSTDPQQAILKIQDTVALLKGQSYEKMVEGIKAWRQSPINTLYVVMSGEAMRAGKSVVAVARERKEAGKESLTAEEVKAIIKLNTLLRF